jgi:H+-transporting ATPase
MEKVVFTTEETKELGIDDLFKKLSSNEKGLSSSEAKVRLQQYGFNEIIEKKKNVILKLLGYFWGPIPWMIEAARQFCLP